jgi:hypothetical protein
MQENLCLKVKRMAINYLFIVILYCIPFLVLSCNKDSSAFHSDSPNKSLSCFFCHIGMVAEHTPVKDSFNNGISPVDMSYYGNTPEFLRAETCRNCHKKEFDTWKHSKHGRSWQNPVFRAGLLIEPAIWCVNCHAPLDLQATESDKNGRINFRAGVNQELRQEGINCAVCHVRDGRIYTHRKPGIPARKRSIHEIYVDPSLARADFCKSCHEFPFPESLGIPVVYSHVPMQSTFGEFHNRFSANEKSCSECHYGDVKKRDHTLLGAKELLRDKKNIKFELQKIVHSETSASLIQVTIHIKSLGHCFPTGDLFRTIEFTAYDGANKLLGGSELARIVDPVTHVLYQDTRLCPDDGEKGIHRTLTFPVNGDAMRCEINYNLQGSVGKLIRSRLRNYKDQNPGALGFIFGEDADHTGKNFHLESTRLDRIYNENFVIPLYSGPCESVPVSEEFSVP